MRSSALVVALLLAAVGPLLCVGCGRLGFEAVGSDASDILDASDGADARACPDACPVLTRCNVDTGSCEATDVRWESPGGAAYCERDTFCDFGATPAPSGSSVSASPGTSRRADLRLDASGAPWVAYGDDSTGVEQIYVKHFDGASWVEVAGSASGGGVSQTATRSYYPSLAIDGTGQPVVAWAEEVTAGAEEIYLRRYDGSAWVEVAGSATGGGISADATRSLTPSLALDASGGLHVVYRNSVDILYRRLAMGAWVEVADSATGDGVSRFGTGNNVFGRLAVDASGLPTVAWDGDSGGDRQVYVTHFDGTAWVELGAGSASGVGISGTAAISTDAHPLIAAGGSPVVAWEDEADGDREIYVRRFEGTTWSEIGAGSASGGGVSDNDGYSSEAHLAETGDGDLVLAWQDYSFGRWQIYVRVFDGVTWQEVGAGSATGAGLSNSQNNSQIPSVDVVGRRVCVAYEEEDGAGTLQILVRCADL